MLIMIIMLIIQQCYANATATATTTATITTTTVNEIWTVSIIIGSSDVFYFCYYAAIAANYDQNAVVACMCVLFLTLYIFVHNSICT